MSTKSNSQLPKMSPMMNHYLELKRQYPDTILLYRLGDFYEMFFDDAIKASKILDLTLTGRDCGLKEKAPMCGVPHHAVEGYIAKLIKSGIKVSLCEQLSSPLDQKGLVKRDVVRIFTPGTVTDDEMLDWSKNNYLAALYCDAENKSAFAYVDISTGELCVNDYAVDKDKLEDILLALSPSEIIANKYGKAVLNAMQSVVQGRMVKPEEYYAYAFDYDNALKEICDFYKVAGIDGFGLTGKSAAVSATGALLRYIETTQKRLLKHIDTPKLLIEGGRMFLDYNTKKNLELLETISDRSRKGSLLSVIDKTETGPGKRLLRKFLQEPLQDEREINSRLTAVEELLSNDVARASLKDLLSQIRDIERLCNKIAYNSIKPRECINIRDSLKCLPEIKKVLKFAKSALITGLRDELDSLEDTEQYLSAALNDEKQSNAVTDGDVIKKGFDKELDEYRSFKDSTTVWLAEYENKLKNETGIRTLKVGYNRVFGYYIEVSNSFRDMVPYSFVRKQTLVNGERYITEELKEMEEKVLGSATKILQIEERIFNEIKTHLADRIRKLQKNGSIIAELDIICGFAVLAKERNYVKPLIGKSINKINIKNGRHPVVEANKNRNEFVPNDTLIDTESNNFLVVTGPNMAGKSTFMRQTALIVLLAHIGSFVPASYAEISIVDRIFTRIGASDNLAYGQSTFMIEMTEVANILSNATSNSLLILDEVGRGTSTIDGLSIAWAIAEYIALKMKAKTLFATHYHELCELESLINGIKNYHILISENKDGITFLYKVARGGASKSFGIEVAMLAGVNRKVIDRAKDIMSELSEKHLNGVSLNNEITAKPSSDAVPTVQIGFFEEDVKNNELISILSDIDIDKLTPIDALTILNDLKKNYAVNKSNKRGKK